MVTTVEVQVVRVVGTTLMRRRTPVETASPLAVKRRTITPTGSRKEDAVAVLLAGYLVAFYTVLYCPGPGAVVEQFVKLGFGRQAPGAAPLFAGDVVGGVAAYVAEVLAVGYAVIFRVAALGRGFAPGVVVAILFGLTCAYVAGGPFYTQAKVYVFVAVDYRFITGTDSAVCMLAAGTCAKSCNNQ